MDMETPKPIAGATVQWVDGRLVIEIPATIQIPLNITAMITRAEDEMWLTPRERLALAGILRGQANKEIAAAMGVSLRTVKMYVSNLLEKFNLSSRGELQARLTGNGNGHSVAPVQESPLCP